MCPNKEWNGCLAVFLLFCKNSDKQFLDKKALKLKLKGTDYSFALGMRLGSRELAEKARFEPTVLIL